MLSCSVCLTLCDPMDCVAHQAGFSVHGDYTGQNTGVGCHVLLQGIFLTQGSNLGLPHYRQILYHLSHQGSPKINWNIKGEEEKGQKAYRPKKMRTLPVERGLLYP